MRPWFSLAVLPGIFVMLCAVAWAQPPQIELRIIIKDRTTLEQLSSEFSVTDYSDGTATVICSPAQEQQLREQGYEVSIIEKPKSTSVTMCTSGWENSSPPSWNCYPTYEQYEAMMHRLAETHPTLCRIHDLGPTSNQTRNHHLWALEITDNPEVDEAEPEVLLTSSMHGDETAGFILTLRLAFELLENYGLDPSITTLVDETEIWINPLANPDGTYYGGDESVRSAIRFLTTPSGAAAWIDPNRNFPDPRVGPHPDGNSWWTETVAMMAFAEERHFALSVNFHGGAELVNYPWDTWCDRHPDNDWFFNLSLAWATAAQEDGPPGYLDDCRQPNCFGGTCTPGVTDGADWYMVAGGRQDYMTFFLRGREVTIELSSTKLLPSEDLETIWTANRRAVMAFIDTAHNGIHGTVVDAATGRPLAATIEIIGVDTAEARSAIVTDPAAGDFHRLLLPGRYDLRVSSLGQKTLRIPNIEVPELGSSPTLDIRLERVEPVEIPYLTESE